MNHLRLAIPLFLLGVPLVLSGCSADDNPVSPEQMQVIRKKQSDEMKQLATSGQTPAKSPSEGK